MKSNKLKIIAIAILVFAIFFGGAFYYTSTKLRPEEIKKMTIEQTKKLFPKAEATLDKVDISWGLNFKVNLEKFSIKAIKENQKIEMISVDQLSVKIPFWAILTGSGILEIKLDAPVLNYQEFTEGNNWTYAMRDKKTEEEKNKGQKEGDKTASSSVLGIFGKSKINVKFADVVVKYSLRDKSKGELKVSRFLIKGLNFESSTAFEIASNANFILKDKSNISFDTIAIGEFNIVDLLKNGSVSSTVIVKVHNIAKSGLDWKFPEITTNIDFLLKKEGELSGKLTTSFESQNKISANFKMTKIVEISDISVDIVLKDIAAIMGLDKSIDLSKAKFSSKGFVTYGEDKKINANLNFNISPGISYSKDGIIASTTIVGELKERDLSVKAKTEALDGQLTTAIFGQFDPNEKFELSKLRPFDIRVVANGMKIPEKVIRAKLWDKKKEEADSVDEEKKLAESSGAQPPPVGLPPSQINIDWSNINVGGEDFSGHGKVITSLTAIAIDNLVFKFSKGSGKISQSMNLGKNSTESKFNLEVTNLNLSSFKAFLPPFVENFTGNFTGKVNGSATMFKNGKASAYDVTVIADAKNGEVKKLNISDYINPMLANIPAISDKMKNKQVKIDGNFETLTMKGHFTNGQYTISAFDFVGINKKVQINGNGEIYPIPGSSKLSLMEVNFIDNTGKISEVLLANVGTKVLPMRVSGPGFDMKPDYAYTISKLAKGALKIKGKDELKKVIDKNIDKLVPAAAKEKVQGLLNGLFKKR